MPHTVLGTHAASVFRESWRSSTGCPPSTATKISAMRTSPVSGSAMGHACRSSRRTDCARSRAAGASSATTAARTRGTTGKTKRRRSRPDGLPDIRPTESQVHGGTLELQPQRSPLGLSVKARPGVNAGIDEQLCHQALVSDIRAQSQSIPHAAQMKGSPDRIGCDAQLLPDCPRACPGIEVQRQQLPYPSHRKSLRRHPASPSIAMAALETRSLLTRQTIRSPLAPLSRDGRHRQNTGRRQRNHGRHQIRTPRGIRSE